MYISKSELEREIGEWYSKSVVLRYDGHFPFRIKAVNKIQIGDVLVRGIKGEDDKKKIYVIEDIGNGFNLRSWEDDLLVIPRIFVDNDAIVFFDVPNPDGEPTSIEDVLDRPERFSCSEIHNYIVDYKKPDYFSTNGYEGDIETVSVTDPCIVFCAFTTYNGQIRYSGVFHAASIPPGSKFFEQRAELLVNTIRQNSEDIVIVKGVGREGSTKSNRDIRRVRKSVTKIFANLGVEIAYGDNLRLGGGEWRITRFRPRTGELVTHFIDGMDKIVL